MMTVATSNGEGSSHRPLRKFQVRLRGHIKPCSVGRDQR